MFMLLSCHQGLTVHHGQPALIQGSTRFLPRKSGSKNKAIRLRDRNTSLKLSPPPKKTDPSKQKNDNLCEQKPVALKQLAKEFKDAAFNSALKRDDPAENKNQETAPASNNCFNASTAPG